MKCKVIAITGQIGSGKSTVGKYLVQKGYSVIDCDSLSRIASTLPDVQQRVVCLLGKDSVVNGNLNRTYIRQLIFSDDNLYSQYNQIFLDKIKSLLTTAVDDLACQQGKNLVFVEIPLIDAFSYNWDEVVLVTSPQSQRIQRVTLRDGVDASDVENISNRQNYVTQPTVTINNDGSLDALFAKIDKLLQNLQSNLIKTFDIVAC